jgi:hypothetical protein
MRINQTILALALIAGAASCALAQFSIPWSTIDGGGGTSTGGNFVLSGTIGQPDAGKSSGGSFSLSGGYWSLGVDTGCPADVDDGSATGTRDGAVTIDDLLYYLIIFESGDAAADIDDDGANPPNPDGGVTIDDLLFFLLRFEAGC